MFALVMAEDGMLTVRALDRIEQALREQGISPGERIESGREIRASGSRRRKIRE